MPVFKKSPTTKKENETNLDDFGTNQAVKQLDSRLCMDCYRDFYTVKNYWKTVFSKLFIGLDKKKTEKIARILFFSNLFLEEWNLPNVLT
ncbi:hypothetical protein Mgra_00004916 [Meloidogyne graminicola]|uniref:Uncharacterized protein n=1 Tax=Meloidogyne graminicola TaxID=189291 RepID=A0A8S9ZR14_9BILA|nr:hypothetical protein Mgra_00004916 [Meloidogyne graminicola]